MTEPVRWLDPDELEAFRAFMGAAWGLPDHLGAELQRESRLSFKEYYVLALLADAPDGRIRMSRLALRINAELSRLSHMVKRLESRDLVRREVDPDDGRFIAAVLTENGRTVQAEAAQGHVTRVRSLFVDVLDPEELATLRRCTEKIVLAVEAAVDRPPSR